MQSNFTESAGHRSKVYRLLALAFSSPTQETNALYQEILRAGKHLGTFEGSSITQETTVDSQLSERLDAEYLRLFVGPGHVPCPPYESSYRTDRPAWQRGLVMAPSTADVRRRYAEAGLKISTKYTDLPDHIAAELEFMHFLAAQEQELVNRDDKVETALWKKRQQEFLTEHIQPWLEKFSASVLASTNSPFYKAAANLLRTFIRNEVESVPLGGER